MHCALCYYLIEFKNIDEELALLFVSYILHYISDKTE